MGGLEKIIREKIKKPLNFIKGIFNAVIMLFEKNV